MAEEPRRGPGRPRKEPSEPKEAAVEPTKGKGKAGQWDKSEWMARAMRVRFCACGHAATRHDDEGEGSCHASAVWAYAVCQCPRFRKTLGKLKGPKSETA